MQVSVGASDVLYLLDADPKTSQSCAVQWWRVNLGPMTDRAKRSLRLFGPPPE